MDGFEIDFRASDGSAAERLAIKFAMGEFVLGDGLVWKSTLSAALSSPAAALGEELQGSWDR